MLSEIYANRESAKLTGILDAFSLLLCWCSSEAEQCSCKAQVVISKFTTSSILEPSIVTVAISNAFAQCGLDYTNVRLWACISMGESVPCKDEVACSSHVRSTKGFRYALRRTR